MRDFAVLPYTAGFIKDPKVDIRAKSEEGNQVIVGFAYLKMSENLMHIEIDMEIKESVVARYCPDLTYKNYHLGFVVDESMNVLYVLLEPIKKNTSHKCTCEISQLLAYGCRCGGV